MRAVVQRVSAAHVQAGGTELGRIESGLMVLIAVGKEDTEEDVYYLSRKIVQLRIFEDDAGKMNNSVLDVGGEILIVSQFTLFGDCRKGNRPSFTDAAHPDAAEKLYNRMLETIREQGVQVQTGQFQARMQIQLVNEGPVTLILDSKKGF
jgi:D-tyrosyl-tRNA(Tyr) deacylase